MLNYTCFRSIYQILKQLLDAATKIEIDALKTSTKKVARKVAEATGELIRSKTANKIVKPNLVPDVNSKYVEEIIIPLKNFE